MILRLRDLRELIDAHGFDLYDDPMSTVADLENYGVRTQSTILAIAVEILGGRRQCRRPERGGRHRLRNHGGH